MFGKGRPPPPRVPTALAEVSPGPCEALTLTVTPDPKPMLLLGPTIVRFGDGAGGGTFAVGPAIDDNAGG